MLVSAARRPDLLRYMPRGDINRLLAPNTDNKGSASDFELFVNALAETETPIVLPRARFAAALRKREFDLDSYSFLTRDGHGNRLEAAAMPVPDEGPLVDIQLIGPLAKASGLGQATRLSSDILRATGLSMRGVDFDLDNPAPEGFSSDTLIENYGPAKINLIHLNAESIPLAFAYQPDVFSGSYNIGYFFWELNKPAYCHYLGMEMLDEIWVSTEYGVEIYKSDAEGKPVINVGMCYEETPDIERESSRAFVNRRFRLDDRHYICLVAFDSFSFVQRKNPVSVLTAFQKAFADIPDARLIVKTQNRDNVMDPVQVKIWDRVDSIIADDNRIVVMNETLSYRDLLQLKAGSDCYISLHKSEGWGFGMIEAMNLGVPVVCTAYSGNMDFCSQDIVWLIDYEKSQLRPGDYIFVRDGSEWAEPNVDHAAKQLRTCYDNPDARETKAQAAQDFIRANFSRDAIARRYGDRLREILQTISEHQRPTSHQERPRAEGSKAP
jgi:glycosyltransferase involved in cell wall biosynthesis